MTGEKKKHSLWAKVMLGITTFLLIFGPKILISYGDTIAVISLCLACGHLAVDGKVHRSVTTVFMLIFVALLYSLLIFSVSGIYFGTLDLYHPLRIFRALVNFAGAYVLCTIYVRLYDDKYLDHILLDIFLAISLHASIMAAMYVSSWFRDFILTVTVFDESHNKAAAGWRIPGLTEGLGTLSVTQMVGLLMVPYVKQYFHGTAGRLMFRSLTAVIIFSLMVSGRTGLILGLALLPIASYAARRPGVRTIRWAAAAAWELTAIALVAGLFILLLKGFVTESVVWRFKNITVAHAFEFYFNYLDDGRIYTRSSDVILQGHFFFPENPLVLWTGNSNSGRGDIGYIPSDTGYVRILFGVGVIGSMLIYTFYLLALMTGIKMWKWHKGISVVSILFVVAVMLANAKSVTALTRNGFTITAMLLCASLIRSRVTRRISVVEIGRIDARSNTHRSSYQ